MFNNKTKLILVIVAVIITIVGLVTGWYLFIFLVLPLGWIFGRNK